MSVPTASGHLLHAAPAPDQHADDQLARDHRADDHLPTPTRRRWQPLRAGLVDLYYYDDQQFVFSDGRLLLRGNNGAGKSKVLALLLPFLLDGDTSGHRMEPDGDGAKKMEWNLLLGGEYPNPERTGYSWLEFGHLDEDGRAHHHTIGFGVKAVSGRGVVKRWFFSTTARVGVDLHLLDATRTALTSDRLKVALEGRGAVVETAREYRALVDEALFGLGEVRYAALVDLLIQLRQPQLSRRPSEARLSDALTSALPPLDQAVLSDVAETFRSLEEDRASLARAQAAHAGVRDFLSAYRRYARAAARRAADPPRRAQSRYEQLGRDLGDARRALDVAQTAHDEAASRVTQTQREVEVLVGRTRALEKDPRHRSVEAVEAARTAVGRLHRDLRDADARAGQARGRRASSQTALQRARADVMTTSARLGGVLERADAEAATAGVPAPRQLSAGAPGAQGSPGAEGSHDPGTLDVVTPPPVTGPWPRAASEAVGRRRRDLARVAELAAAQEAAARQAQAREAEAERLDAEVGAAGERHAQAVAERDAAASAHVAAVAAWAQALVELPLPDPDGLVADVQVWAETLDGPSPAPAVVASARDTRADALATTRAAREAELTAVRERAAALRDEQARLERGGHLPPTPWPTRDATSRTGRPGAPLWQVVDVRTEASADGSAQGLDDAQRAGLEAALEGAGLLDAWVTPDGAVLDGVRDDVLLHPTEPARRPATSLADVLVASLPEHPDDGVELPSVDAVTAVLASIGVQRTSDGESNSGSASGSASASASGTQNGSDSGDVWVALDGTFATPVSRGSWHKDAAEHLGASSRERARLARLAVVRAELADADQSAFDLTDALDDLQRAGRALSTEAAALPGPQALLASSATVLALAGQREGLRARLADAVTARDDALAAHRQAVAAVAEAASDLSLPAEAAGRASVEAALTRYELALVELFAALEALATAQRDEAERSDAERADAAESAESEAEVRRRTLEHASAAEDLAVTERTVGADAAALLAELEQVRELAAAAATAREEADAALGRSLEVRGAAAATVRGLEGQLDDVTAVRDDAVERLRTFATTGLLTVALPELEVPDPAQPWAADPSVRLARRVESELADVATDDDAFSRARDRVSSGARALDDVLALDGHRAVLYLRDEGIVIDVTFRGRTATVVELEAALAADVAARGELLDAREREVIETYLVEEVASTLAELIADAEAQVAAMNAELDTRPTSTGMRLHLNWKVREDGPPGLAAARARLLRQSSDAWSDADREAVGAFLTDQIRAVRAADPGGAWLDQLTRALDHRSWHRFTISRWSNGQWRSATGPASGGERVLAASVPLFAAASAHYGSAPNPHAPRLIMLDEAFAGVDDTARADYLGLLAAFDLDVVMTSEREWACYPQVPGIGISQLSRLDGVDAVLVTPWRWDGEALERLPEPGPTAAPRPAAVPGGGEEQDGLWDDL